MEDVSNDSFEKDAVTSDDKSIIGQPQTSLDHIDKSAIFNPGQLDEQSLGAYMTIMHDEGESHPESATNEVFNCDICRQSNPKEKAFFIDKGIISFIKKKIFLVN